MNRLSVSLSDHKGNFLTMIDLWDVFQKGNDIEISDSGVLIGKRNKEYDYFKERIHVTFGHRISQVVVE
jgi:hypothetical protein